MERESSLIIFVTVQNLSLAGHVKRRHEQVRLNNLEILVSEAGSAAALARLANTNDSYLSQIRRQLTTRKGTPRGVGNGLAAKLEQAMGKPSGWMDVAHVPIHGDHQACHAKPGSDVRRLHPLISWVQAGNWADTARSSQLGDAKDLLPCPVRCSRDTFVLRVRGQSMEPKFHEGDLIFVDPRRSPESGNYVIVRIEDAHEAMLKQLIVEGGQQYLKALNPDWPNRIIEVNSNATIGGVVVFKGEVV